MKNSKFIVILKVILLVFSFNSITLLADDDIVFIPDSAFKAVLLNHWPTIDRNGDGEIQVSEAEAFDPHGETLKAYGEGVHDLTGIKAFINADWVITGGELITEIDVTGMENWLFLEIYYSNITELDLEGCTSLSTLQCNNNSKLTSIDVSDCENLYILDCGNNYLSTLDLSNNINIGKLYASDNLLNIIDLTNNYNLNFLWLHNNFLVKLDISHLNKLDKLKLSNNNITQINMPENADIIRFSCDRNIIDEMDLSLYENLESVYAYTNSLVKLNLKNGNNLNLDELDVLDNPNLKCVDVDDPQWSEENWREYFDEDVVFSLDCKSCIEEKAEKSFRVYPNPTKDYVYVNRYSDKASKLRIIDISGRVCQEVDLPQGQHEVLINISGLSSGSYIIDIDDAIEMLVVE